MSYKNIHENTTLKTSSIKNLETNLNRSIFGQKHAIKEIVNKIMISESGLGDENKPIASFLFTGPTGVGKTELAIELAKNLNLNFVRFDMSEYSGQHGVSTLIGGEKSLVGYEEGGILTNAIMQNPKCVLLLDEIEKAHQIILNTFLQVLDYGTLTDKKGRKVNFKNVIIIMTSNLGATTKNSMGFGSNSKTNKDDAINEFLSPELRARIDSKIEFNPLTNGIVQRITKKFCNQLLEKLKQQDKTMVITEKAVEEINNQAYNSKLGARYISKIINDTIKQKVAYELLFGEFKTNYKVTIDFQDDFVYEFTESGRLQSTITSDTLYFHTAQEAEQYAKANPGITITRAKNGEGFVVKE